MKDEKHDDSLMSFCPTYPNCQLADASVGRFELKSKAVNEMKSGKAPRLDGFKLECLKKDGIAVLEWLVRLLNVSFDMGVVSMNCCGSCTPV